MSARLQYVLPAGGGDITALRKVASSIAPPAVGEVQVRVRAIGLNFADVFSGLGLYGPVSSGELKGDFVPGLEFAGEVVSVGAARRPDGGTLDGAQQQQRGGQLAVLDDSVWSLAHTAAGKLTTGDRVMGAMRFGSYATVVNVPAHQVRRVPEAWGWEEAAAAVVQTLTVYYALARLARVRAGEVVLVHSAAGGCGMQAVRICHKLGAHPIACVGSEAKVAPLLARFGFLKREQVVVRGNPAEFQGQVEAAAACVRVRTGGGVDVVLDAVLGEFFRPGYEAMRAGGRYVVYGAASMTPAAPSLSPLQWVRLAWKWLWRPKLDLLEMPGQNKTVSGFNLIHCLNDAPMLAELMDEVEGLQLPPPHVGTTYSFDRLVEGLQEFQKGATVGKVVVTVDSA